LSKEVIMISRATGIVLSTIFASVTASGQALRPEAYGTTDATIHAIPATAFLPLVSASTYNYDFTGGLISRYRTGGTDPYFQAFLDLPSGTVVTGIEIDGCDSSATGELFASLVVCPTSVAGPCVFVNGPSTGVAAMPGCGIFFAPVGPVTVDNNLNVV